MTIPDNPLGLKKFRGTDGLDRFLPPLQTRTGGDCLQPRDRDDYSTRYAMEMKKQDILEARLPKEMRESIEAENSHRALLRQLLNG